MLDIAGGKGLLSEALAVAGLRSVLVDPCALTGRDPASTGTFAPAGGSTAAPGPVATAAVPAGRKPKVVHRGAPAAVLVLRQTLEQLLATEPALFEHCVAAVGLHPDEATEGICDAALAHQRPFAVVPCCVFPNLFPGRRLRSSGARVKKIGAFMEYLREKDHRIQTATLLGIAGRKTVLFMRAEDYSMPAVRPPPPDFRPAAAAAKAGDLRQLQALLEREGGCDWNADTARQAAWAGHLKVLVWLRQAGCPWDHSSYVEAATFGKQQAVLRWLAALHGGLVSEVGGGATTPPAVLYTEQSRHPGI